jgi:hypothetical protein
MDIPLCKKGDPDDWFPTSPRSLPPGEERDKLEAAYKKRCDELRAVCRQCPLLHECYEQTMREEAGKSHLHIHGFRAGLSERQRRRAARAKFRSRQGKAA